MKIVLDVMSGDKPLSEFVAGAILAKRKHKDYEITLVGNEREIREYLDSVKEPLDGFEIVHADDVITMEDEPMSILKEHSNSSMAKTIDIVASNKADAAVSAGNTGAFFTGSSLKAKRIKGVRRAALATMINFGKPLLLLDCGATINVTPEYLLQFAYLGKAYMECIMGVQNPRIGLLNNGTEDHKGTTIHVEANKLLKEQTDINYIGNIESKSAIVGGCDVLVADGFSGNIMLKTCEGVGKLIFGLLKENVFSGVSGKISAMLVVKDIKNIANSFDAKKYGGAPFLGLSKPIIKAHGNSDKEAVCAALEQAAKCVETGVVDKISMYFDKFPKVQLKKDEIKE
ncbi:MAG: phosphate acyltransferase PlsX [Clostridia bacterium]|nr:phosphate acyltransferase PlsX [Clostridia bacterium]